MDLLLKVFGGLALLALLGVGLVVFFIWWKLRAFAKAALGAGMPPSTIDLVEDKEADWPNQRAVADDLRALTALGYQRGPVYDVEGIAGVSLVSLVHPATGIHGAYYRHPAAGHWVDLCANLEDGNELTASSAPMGEQMDTRPDTEKVFRKGAAPAELHALLLERLRGRTVRRVGLEGFCEEFKSAYARDMAWRNSRNGTTEEEFMRIAESEHPKLTEEQLREAYAKTKANEIEMRAGEALEKFATATTLSVAEWKKYEGKMVIYREDFHAAGYLDYLESTVGLSDEDVARYREALNAGLSLKGLLQRIGNDSGRQFVGLGRVEEPVGVEVFGVTEPVARAE